MQSIAAYPLPCRAADVVSGGVVCKALGGCMNLAVSMRTDVRMHTGLGGGFNGRSASSRGLEVKLS